MFERIIAAEKDAVNQTHERIRRQRVSKRIETWARNLGQDDLYRKHESLATKRLKYQKLQKVNPLLLSDPEGFLDELRSPEAIDFYDYCDPLGEDVDFYDDPLIDPADYY